MREKHTQGEASPGQELGRACEARKKQEVDFVSLMTEIYEMQLMWVTQALLSCRWMCSPRRVCPSQPRYHRTALQHLEAIKPQMDALKGLREQAGQLFLLDHGIPWILTPHPAPADSDQGDQPVVGAHGIGRFAA